MTENSKKELRILKVFNWDIKTDCICSHSDWEPVKEQSSKALHYVWCAKCKKYAYNIKTGKKIAIVVAGNTMNRISLIEAVDDFSIVQMEEEIIKLHESLLSTIKRQEEILKVMEELYKKVFPLKDGEKKEKTVH